MNQESWRNQTSRYSIDRYLPLLKVYTSDMIRFEKYPGKSSMIPFSHIYAGKDAPSCVFGTGRLSFDKNFKNPVCVFCFFFTQCPLNKIINSKKFHYNM